jgi:O-phosphoseryl-tRNA(Cys) synthetase
MTEINQDQLEEKINIINNVLHYYDGCRDEGDRVVECIVTAMTEDGVVGEEYDEVIDEVVTHMVAVIKLMEL